MAEKLLQESLENPSPEDRQIRRNVLEDMKEVGRKDNPLPQEDWDLVWVLSGPPVDIAEEFGEGSEEEVLFDVNDKIAAKDVVKKINETRERLLTGIELAKEIAAKRLNKQWLNLL